MKDLRIIFSKLTKSMVGIFKFGSARITRIVIWISLCVSAHTPTYAYTVTTHLRTIRTHKNIHTLTSLKTHLYIGSNAFLHTLNQHTYACTNCGVIVIVIKNGHADQSSKPGRGRLHFTKSRTFRKDMNLTTLLQAKGK